MNQGQEQRVNAKILIVDDTAISRKLLAEILRREKYDIYEAIDGASGLKIAQLASPDLILLDICMPGLNGYVVCQHLKKQPETRNTPVIFVTASTQHGARMKALGCGGNDYITKPFAIPELKQCVAYHLQS
ncbi:MULTISPECIES: response regulator [unclassified Leptolyngbya]|uniref:response regulator n=1 Tax=unclassified Leptolyngbya TaxID=2650499 RepID=UPI001687DFC8|nr:MULTISPECIES: response regulator [unclassified Leptolyngbya]MBD1910628.1 response regulator [Leptolyngbya sp. FACHB-8]MBD2154568.1 response regulator [Leptolyngbya sp. FACHB-16]